MKNFHIGDLERALYERRSLVRMLGEGKKWGGDFGISTRVLFLLATEGRIVRARPKGSWISSQYRWATTASWIGPLRIWTAGRHARSWYGDGCTRSDRGPSARVLTEWLAGTRVTPRFRTPIEKDLGTR